MPKVVIEIETGNDVFISNGTSVEIVKILRDLCQSIEISEIRSIKMLRDTDGNKVGEYKFLKE